jgi:hypothetical protein
MYTFLRAEVTVILASRKTNPILRIRPCNASGRDVIATCHPGLTSPSIRRYERVSCDDK